MRLVSLLVGFAFVACSVGAFAAEGLVDNPAYKSWAKYKPGTVVVYTQESDVGVGMKMPLDMTQTLNEVTADHVAVEAQMQNPMSPTPQKRTMTIPAKVAADKAVEAGRLPDGMTGQTKAAGNEKVKIGDTEYDCVVSEFAGERGGTRIKGKTWTTDTIPGGLVKAEMKVVGPANILVTTTLKSVAVKQ